MSDNHDSHRRTFLKGIAASSILGVAGCLNQTADGGGGGESGNSSNNTGSNPGSAEQWTLGTSSQGSSSYRIGSTWTSYANQNDLLNSVNIEPVITEGTSASYRRFDAGQYEISGTTTQLLETSPDEGSYSEQPLQNFDSIRQVRGYMGFYNFGLYNADAVSGWDDLEGASVAISSAGSGTRPPVEWLVDQEIGLDNIDNRYMAFADIPSALRSGQVDAAFTWTVNQDIAQGWFQEIDATVNWKPLMFSDSTKQALSDELSYSTYVQLDEETVTSFTENYSGPIDSFTLTYLYVVKASASNDVVYDIAKFTHEHGEDLVNQDKVMGFFPDADAFLGTLHPDVPIHQGAYQYYKEAGLWEDYDLTAPPETN